MLCDNDVDRQMERFDEETLEQLARMFVGKTGICDHQPKTANQLARIYQAQVEYFPGKTNLLGEPYCAVVAKAYMVRTESNRDLILEIEAGIKKEVSVGCSIRESRCSICQSERTLQDCGHRKGNGMKEGCATPFCTGQRMPTNGRLLRCLRSVRRV